MSKVKIFALLLMMLLSITASTAIASAKIKNKKIDFNSSADGSCFAINGLDLFGTHNEFWWFGEGNGNANLTGSAKEIELYSDPDYGDIFKAEDVKVECFISLSWTEDDEVHWIEAELSPTDSTTAFLKPDVLLAFSMPGAVTPLEEMLSFNGKHVYSADNELIEDRIWGIGCWFTVPGLFGLSGVDFVTLNLMNMEEPHELEDGTTVYKCYATFWANDDLYSPLPGIDLIPAADNLEWEMEIKS